MEDTQRIEIIEVPCPTCQGSQKRVVQADLRDVEDRIEGHYTISECLDCDFKFLSRTPSPGSLPHCYLDDYHVRSNRRYNVFRRFLYGLRTHLRLWRIQQVLGSAQPKWIRHARQVLGSTQPQCLLEIGCGDASLLIGMEKQWPAGTLILGTDIDVSRIELPEGSKIKLFTGGLSQNIAPGQLDMVVLYEVLEHFSNPLTALKEIRGLLKPGAPIFGTLPRFDSFWSRMFPLHWAGLQIPRHQSYFSPGTLKGLFERAGFRVISIRPAFDPGEISVSICNWLTDRLGLKTPPRQAVFFFPLIVLTAPIAWLQLVLFRSSGTMEFVAIRE